MKRYISVHDACIRWAIGRTQLYKLLRLNAIVAVKLGRRTLIDIESGDNFMTSLPHFEGEGSDQDQQDTA